jgi:hypothetical protein
MEGGRKSWIGQAFEEGNVIFSTHKFSSSRLMRQDSRANTYQLSFQIFCDTSARNRAVDSHFLPF